MQHKTAKMAHRIENYLHGPPCLIRHIHPRGRTQTFQLKAKNTPSWKMGKGSDWQFLFEKNSNSVYSDHGSSPLIPPSSCLPTQHHGLPLCMSVENNQARKQTKVDLKKLRKHTYTYKCKLPKTRVKGSFLRTSVCDK